MCKLETHLANIERMKAKAIENLSRSLNEMQESKFRELKDEQEFDGYNDGKGKQQGYED